MKRKRVWIGLGAAAAAALCAFAARAMSRPAAVVGKGPIAEVVVAQGQVVARAGVAEVRARLDGRVARVLVREGDRVEAGQLLAEIDAAEIKARVGRLRAEARALGTDARAVRSGARVETQRAAEAQLAQAEAQLAQAEDRARRMLKLHQAGALSERGLVEADREVEAARARVEEARAQRDLSRAGRKEDVLAARDRALAAASAVDEAERLLDRSRVVAPIAGVILARHVDPGDTIAAPGLALFEVADPTDTEILLELEEPDALRVAVGLEVTLTPPGGGDPIGTARLDRLGARLAKRTIGADDARQRAEHLVRPAWATLTSPLPDLPIGKRLEARVHLPARDVGARLPRAAIRIEDGRAVVTTWLGLTRPVTLGATDPSHVELTDLPPGTRVRLPQ